MIACLFLGACAEGSAQSYGLGFQSFEVVQDRRTGLDLSPGRNLCLDGSFELSFDMTFFAEKEIYFGYVFRLIGDDGRNVDLIYDNSDSTLNHFKVVVGSALSPIAFDIPADRLFGQWNTIRLRFDPSRNNLTLKYGSESMVGPLQVSKETCFKLLFGAARYNNFSTTDVPPMKVRDVRITQEGNLAYHWPLNEADGTEVREAVRGAAGSVDNPLWIKKLHTTWQPLKKLTLDGPARVTFDAQAGVVYVVGRDTLVRYRVATDQLAYSGHARQSLFMDNQVLYVPSRNKIYNLYPNEQRVTELAIDSNRWKANVPDSSITTYFLHANKFYSPEASAIYLLGGYGQLKYKNSVQRYDLREKTWKSLPLRDTLFRPRYLAALGATKGGAYLLGGYGSVTGKQTLNPGSWHDLLFFSTKSNSFKRIYRFEGANTNYVFANSLVVQAQDSVFYALTFPKDKFDTEMQMVRGSLTRPEFAAVGSPIPFKFLDTNSYADLYFDEHTSRFVAVTLFKLPAGKTEVAIYSLYAPPLAITSQPVEPSLVGIVGKVGIAALALALVLGALAYFKFRGSAPQRAAQPVPVSDRVEAARAAPVAAVQTVDAAVLPPPKNSIFLFGNLQIFSAEGREITRKFTPLLKELFLILLLYSTRREGISSERLTELLWPDKSTDSARNNRSVNLNKLRAIMAKLDHCSVSKESGYWRLNIDFERLRVDYAHYLQLTTDKRALDKKEIEELLEMTARGGFLADLEYDWLDRFKGEVSSEVIDAYLHYAATVEVASDPDFLIRLADSVFRFDPVNEEAMILKCKALSYLGNHSLAQTTWENFAREYRRIYGEDFEKDMRDVLNS